MQLWYDIATVHCKFIGQVIKGLLDHEQADELGAYKPRPYVYIQP